LKNRIWRLRWFINVKKAEIMIILYDRDLKYKWYFIVNKKVVNPLKEKILVLDKHISNLTLKNWRQKILRESSVHWCMETEEFRRTKDLIIISINKKI
jgi:hypothetical protein